MINVLCLHGCSQTADAFASYLKSLTSMAKKTQFTDPKITFHYLQAPFIHPDGGFTWTNPPLTVKNIWCDALGEQTDPFKAIPNLERDDTMVATAFEEIKAAIDKYDISVLLGFSQGSFMIYEYLAKFNDPRIKRAVVMSGYTFIDTKDQLEQTILNVINPMDNIVPAILAYKNAKVYTLEHNNKNFTSPCREAHIMPTRNAQTRAICQFIQTGDFVNKN